MLPGAVGSVMAAAIARVGVMVTAWSWSRKLSQDELSLVEGHETHSSQREANHRTQSRREEHHYTRYAETILIL